MIKVYLISTAISSLIIVITLCSIKERLKREGYRSKTKYSFIEKIQGYIYLLIPVFNILMAYTVLFHTDKIYKGLKEDKDIKIDKEL